MTAEPRARVLVVEDDRVARRLTVEVMHLDGHETTEAASAEEALVLVRGGEAFDLVISDVRMGAMDGMALLAELQAREPELPVLLLTGFGDVEGAIRATQAGAADYLAKPFDIGELRQTVARALERRRLTQERGSDETTEFASPAGGIVGRSPAMLALYKLVARTARSRAPVLVSGESGTGKELVARALHAHSLRSDAPFVAVSCAAMAESLLESELFGHEKGAFTGAEKARRGLFEQATGGTLFLDEIGEVSPRMQVQLLRVLQEGEVRRVGGAEAVKVDVRVVAATHQDLEAMVREGRFREDLLFRLRVVTLHLPPLRERPEDIPPLVEHLLSRAALREGRRAPSLSPEALTRLVRHPWPGNVRELRNAVERALAVASTDVLLASDLPPELGGPLPPEPPASSPAAESIFVDRPTLAVLERRYVDLVLRETGGNKKRAAEILGIDRRTLYRTLDRSDESDGDAE
ncbi:MAG: Acetoacetate metabolism regulatory protein AtoC [Pseudomonadota bacterium]|jgi:DNA-binding NtrC family response regulator